jgi:hypothetical protein
MNDQVDIFDKYLSKSQYIKLHTMLGIQKDAIMGGCRDDVISHSESPNMYVDGGCCDINK